MSTSMTKTTTTPINPSDIVSAEYVELVQRYKHFAKATSENFAPRPNCHRVKTRGRTRAVLREILFAVALERHDAWTGAEHLNERSSFVDAVDEAEDGLRQLLGGLHRGVVADAVELDGTDPR